MFGFHVSASFSRFFSLDCYVILHRFLLRMIRFFFFSLSESTQLYALNGVCSVNRHRKNIEKEIDGIKIVRRDAQQ